MAQNLQSDLSATRAERRTKEYGNMFIPVPQGFFLAKGIVKIFILLFRHLFSTPKKKEEKRPREHRPHGPRHYRTAKEIDNIIKKITSL